MESGVLIKKLSDGELRENLLTIYTQESIEPVMYRS